VKGEEFSVTLPSLPAMTTTKTFQSRIGKNRLERQLKTSVAGVVYSIYVFENPKPRQSLEQFIAEQSAHSGHDLTTERNLTVSGFAGKEYSSLNRTPPFTVQFFSTERRLYRFVASGAYAQHAGMKQFFSTIVLGDKTEGIKVSDGPGLAAEIFTRRDVDSLVRLIKKPEPSYTEKARQNAITGAVVLKAIFSATGKVTNIEVVSGLPHGLTERAVDAAKKIKFIPGMKDGRPVSMWMQLEYHFDLY
jgi:TonB family protein